MLVQPRAAPGLEPEYGRAIRRETEYWILEQASSDIQGDQLKLPLL